MDEVGENRLARGIERERAAERARRFGVPSQGLQRVPDIDRGVGRIGCEVECLTVERERFFMPPQRHLRGCLVVECLEVARVDRERAVEDRDRGGVAAEPLLGETEGVQGGGVVRLVGE